MEPSVMVALVGLGGVFITSAAGVVVAIITNRRETTGAADEGVERALRERLALRDEQIRELKEDTVALKEEREEKDELIAILRRELRECKNHGPTEDGTGLGKDR